MYGLSPLTIHLTDTQIVIDAGATLPPTWHALRDRHAQPAETTMMGRYVDSILTGTGDRDMLAVLATVEATADHQAAAAVRSVASAAVAGELATIYSGCAATVFDQMRDRLAAAVSRMSKCCNAVDVLCPPETLLQSTSAQRTSWGEAVGLAQNCDDALNSLAAAYRLSGGAHPMETFDQQLALVACAEDFPGVKIRQLFADWQSTSRAGRWPRCLWAKPRALGEVMPVDPPPPMTTVMERVGIGWRPREVDPLVTA